MAKVMFTISRAKEYLLDVNHVYMSLMDIGICTSFVEVTKDSKKYVFSNHYAPSASIRGVIVFGVEQVILGLRCSDKVEVRPFFFDEPRQYLQNVKFEVFSDKFFSIRTHDTDRMAQYFLSNYIHFALNVGQIINFEYGQGKMVYLVVRELEVQSVEDGNLKEVKIGLVESDTNIVFFENPRAGLCLEGTRRIDKDVSDTIIHSKEAHAEVSILHRRTPNM